MPTNHTSLASFEVPVLPAIGMPSFDASTPVPDVTTDFIMSVTTYATSGSITCFASAAGNASAPIDSMNTGLAALPPAANVASALTCSIGVTSPAPSASAGVVGIL